MCGGSLANATLGEHVSTGEHTERTRSNGQSLCCIGGRCRRVRHRSGPAFGRCRNRDRNDSGEREHADQPAATGRTSAVLAPRSHPVILRKMADHASTGRFRRAFRRIDIGLTKQGCEHDVAPRQLRVEDQVVPVHGQLGGVRCVSAGADGVDALRSGPVPGPGESRASVFAVSSAGPCRGSSFEKS